jgi:transposase
MPNRPVRRRLVRLLGSLPLIADFARRLGIETTIDPMCPSRGNALLTHGQVALTIIANRLTQPKAMYQLLAWAAAWGVREVFGVNPDCLNDDRLGRCLDALAPQIDAIQGTVIVAAVREFDLDLSQLHWDLTSVVLQGEYPPEEQHPAFPRPAITHFVGTRFGGEAHCKQLRAGELVTNDGGVPVWHHSYDGNQADVGTVVAQMEAVRAHLPLPECLVIGDSKLLSEAVIGNLRRQHLHFLAPLPRTAELDREFLALDPAGWQPLEYVAKRQARLPPEERTQYQGQEVTQEWVNPDTGEIETFRRLYVISSEERATCRKVRGQQQARAEAELAKVRAGLGKRQLKTVGQVEARVERVLKERRVAPLYQVTVGEAAGALTLTWEVNAAALARAEALDGYYVLLTSWLKEQADSSALLRKWKQEEQIERRFSDWKGPLKVRPVFVTSNARMAALVLLLHLALMLYCLLEREARRQLAAKGRQKVGDLLAGHVDAVPTGENILRAFEHLFLIIEEDEHGRAYEMSAFSVAQEQLWRLLGIREPAWA